MMRFSFQTATAPAWHLSLPRPLAPSVPLNASCPIDQPSHQIQKGSAIIILLGIIGECVWQRKELPVMDKTEGFIDDSVD